MVAALISIWFQASHVAEYGRIGQAEAGCETYGLTDMRRESAF